MQAQDDHIHAGHQFLLGERILAQGRINADDLDAGHASQTVADLQAGGAGFAINENGMRTHACCSWVTGKLLHAQIVAIFTRVHRDTFMGGIIFSGSDL